MGEQKKSVFSFMTLHQSKDRIKNRAFHKTASKETLIYLSKVAGGLKLLIAATALIELIYTVGSIYSAFVLRSLIDAVAAGNQGGFYHTAIWYTLILVVQILCGCLKRFLDEYTRSSLENKFKERLFHGLLWKEYSAVAGTHSGEWMNRLTSDTVTVANLLTDIVPNLAGKLVGMVGAVYALYLLQPYFLLFLIPGGLLILLFSTLFRSITKSLHKNIQTKNGELQMFFLETLSSMMVVRTFSAEKMTLSDALAKMKRHQRARMRKNHFSNLITLGYNIAMNGVYLFGVIFSGYGILNKTMSFGDFTAVLQLIRQVQTPMSNISMYLPQYYSMLASAERLMEIEKQARKELVEAMELEEVLAAYSSDFEAIGLENVCFTYQSQEGNSVENVNSAAKEHRSITLSHVSLEIRKGQFAAFTGASGCGKSTIFKLLMCLYDPDSGKRYVKLSHQTKPFTSRWQKLFAYVPQGNHLMSGTIREIVAFSDREASADDGRIWNALKASCADEFVRELKEGLDTALGEGGAGLSEGQMQRIAIARAVFSRHPILMLDECTSALDLATERALLHNLRSFTDKTVLFVTHRPAALEICDIVIDLSKESLTEDGLTEEGRQ